MASYIVTKKEEIEGEKVEITVSEVLPAMFTLRLEWLENFSDREYIDVRDEVTDVKFVLESMREAFRNHAQKHRSIKIIKEYLKEQGFKAKFI